MCASHPGERSRCLRQLVMRLSGQNRRARLFQLRQSRYRLTNPFPLRSGRRCSSKPRAFPFRQSLPLLPHYSPHLPSQHLPFSLATCRSLPARRRPRRPPLPAAAIRAGPHSSSLSFPSSSSPSTFTSPSPTLASCTPVGASSLVHPMTIGIPWLSASSWT